jgi:exonuclease VII large subunit
MTTQEDSTAALKIWGSNIRNIRNSLKRSLESALNVIEVIPARMNSRIHEFHKTTSIPYYAEHYARFSPDLRSEIEEIMKSPMADFDKLEKMASSNPARRALKRKTAESIIDAYDALGKKIASQVAVAVSA